MFVGFSKSGISVIVKLVQHVGIIRTFFLPGGTSQIFKCLRRQIKLLGCGLPGGGAISTQADTMNFFLKPCNMLLQGIFQSGQFCRLYSKDAADFG